MQERFAELIDKHGHAFAEEVLTTPAKDGKGPDGHGWAYSFDERFAVIRECLDRSYGRPAQSVAVEQQVAEKTILEVRWLPPDPNDHSKVIEPEPD
jgi:hypothetical protein